VKISLLFEDLETDKAWEKIAKNKEYSMIIAHYLGFELKDPEAMIARAAGCLSDKGVFSYNGPGSDSWYRYLQDVFAELKIKAPFVDKTIAAKKKTADDTVKMLKKYFSKVELIALPNKWHYTDAAELFDKFMEFFEEQEKFMSSKRDKLVRYFAKKIEKDGEIVLEAVSYFWHCMR
jgi:hypothetical protein